MLVNYVRNAERDSPLNLAVARFAVGTYAVWKLASYEWTGLQQWPYPVIRSDLNGYLVSEFVLEALRLEVVVTGIFLLLFAVGYRIGVSGFLSALLIAHLSGVHYTVTNSASTFLPVVYFCLFVALYREIDVLSVDGIRRTKHRSLDTLNSFLQTPDESSYPLPPMKWFLLTFAFVYFFTGFAKVQNGLFQWTTGGNLSRTIYLESLMHLQRLPPIGEFLIERPLLATLSAWGTVLLEIAFLVAVLSGLTLWPFALALLGMHTLIFLTMSIFFFDQYLLFVLFLPWDTLLTRTTADESLTVLYDDRSRSCARSLYPFRLLDTDGRISFVSPSTADRSLPPCGSADPEGSVYVFHDGASFRGYHAFRRLLAHFRVFQPIAWLMNVRPVRAVGMWLYSRVVATQRSHVVRSAEDDSD
jgi:hypothetical protein